jgi:hypothetical protein
MIYRLDKDKYSPREEEIQIIKAGKFKFCGIFCPALSISGVASRGTAGTE